jgi:hypothetical protein
MPHPCHAPLPSGRLERSLTTASSTSLIRTSRSFVGAGGGGGAAMPRGLISRPGGGGRGAVARGERAGRPNHPAASEELLAVALAHPCPKPGGRRMWRAALPLPESSPTRPPHLTPPHPPAQPSRTPPRCVVTWRGEFGLHDRRLLGDRAMPICLCLCRWPALGLQGARCESAQLLPLVHRPQAAQMAIAVVAS